MRKILIPLLLLLVLIGCGQSNNNSFDFETPVEVDSEFYGDIDVDNPRESEEETINSVFDPTKIVKTGSFRIESRDYETDKTTLESMISSLNGFIEQSNVIGHPAPDNPYSNRELTLTLRIPSSHFDEFVSQLNDQFTLIQQSTQAKSVADSYYDSENRIKVLEVQQDRLLELLNDANDLSDIVLLQEQLMDVEYDLNIHKGNLQKLDDQIDYSTIRITMSELSDSQSSIQTNNFFDELSRAFSRGISSIVLTIQTFILFLAENFIWLLLLIIFSIVIYRVVQRPKEKPKSE